MDKPAARRQPDSAGAQHLPLGPTMIEIEVQRDIYTPIADVFTRLIDIPSYSSWLPDDSASLSCTLTSSGPITAGTTYIDLTKDGPMCGEVLELEEPTRVVFRQRLKKFGLWVDEALQTNRLETIDGRTRVHHRFNYRLAGPLTLLDRFTVRSGERERNIVLTP